MYVDNHLCACMIICVVFVGVYCLTFFFFFVVGLAGPQGPEGVTSSSGLTSQLSPDPRQLLGLTRPPIPRGTVGGGHESKETEMGRL